MLDMQGWVSYSETFNYTIINENAIKLDIEKTNIFIPPK